MPSSKKTELIQIRVRPEVKAEAERKAESIGMTLSEYIRTLLGIGPHLTKQVLHKSLGLEASLMEGRLAVMQMYAGLAAAPDVASLAQNIQFMLYDELSSAYRSHSLPELIEHFDILVELTSKYNIGATEAEKEEPINEKVEP